MTDSEQPMDDSEPPTFYRPSSEGSRRARKPSLGLQPGQKVGEFLLRRVIGEGGMGQVWEASQESLRRLVAIKFVHPDRVSDRHLQLFAREARAGGRLAHPGIVTVYGYGETNGLAWIAMELVSGSCDLRDFLDSADGSFPPEPGYDRSVAKLVAEIADAAQAAHDSDVIHRDLKPQNILITEDDRPKITDFGLARIVGETALSRTGEVAGTYRYMSPEQVSGAGSKVDHRTDIFSLGAVFYELLVNAPLFRGDLDHEIAEKILNEVPLDPRELRRDVPFELAAIVAGCLEKEPKDRYASMSELAADLRRWLNGIPIRVKAPAWLPQWYYRSQGQDAVGPVTSKALIKLIKSGHLQSTDEVLKEGQARWRSVSSVRSASTMGDSRIGAERHAPSDPTIPTGPLGLGRGALLLVLAGLLFLATSGTLFFWPSYAADPEPRPSPVPPRPGPPEYVEADEEQPDEFRGPVDETDKPRLEPATTVDRRAEYAAVASGIQGGTRVVSWWDLGPNTPIPEVVDDLDHLMGELTDPRLRQVAQSARNWWATVPHEEIYFEVDSLESVFVNLVLMYGHHRLNEGLSRALGAFQEGCWTVLEEVTREEWSSGPDLGELVTVTVTDPTADDRALDVVLESRSAAPLENVTIRVDFDSLRAKTITNHYYYAALEPGTRIDLSRDPRLLYASLLFVATTTTVWSDDGIQRAIRTEYPERRKEVERHWARVDAIEADLASLESALQEGRRLEGGWALGIHSGRIGFELVRRPQQSSIFEQEHQVRLYEPENPAVYRVYGGRVRWNEARLRHEFVIQGKSGGLPSGTREPSSADFLVNERKTLVLYGSGEDLRGEDDRGTCLQLHPAGTPQAGELLADPSNVATAPDAKPPFDPMPPAVVASAPQAETSSAILPKEIARWDAWGTPIPAFVIRDVSPVQLSDDGRAVYWLNGRRFTRLDLRRGTQTSTLDVFWVALPAVGGTLVTGLSNEYRLRSATSLEMTGPPNPQFPRTYKSPKCARAVALGRNRIAYASHDGRLHVVTERGDKKQEFDQTGQVVGLCFSPTSNLLFASMRDGNINVWDVDEGRYVLQLRETGILADARVSEDEEVVLTVERQERGAFWRVCFWDLASGEELHSLPFPGATTAAVSDDWTRVVTGYANDGRGYVWSLRSGALEGVLRGHKRPLVSADFADDGNALVTGDSNGWIVHWRLE